MEKIVNDYQSSQKLRSYEKNKSFNAACYSQNEYFKDEINDLNGKVYHFSFDKKNDYLFNMTCEFYHATHFATRTPMVFLNIR